MTNEHKRYGWFRLYEGVYSHPVWQRAALIAECRVVDALGVGIVLMAVASKGRPRGSVQEFDPVSCGAALGIPPDQVRAIYKALEDGTKPFLERRRIVDWDERQPMSDATNSERQHRYRERKRGTREALMKSSSNVTVTSRNVTSRSRDVTVTYRDLDSKLIDSSTLVLEQKGTGEGSPVKPPHMATRAELDEVVERKRLEREETLRAKRAAIQT